MASTDSFSDAPCTAESVVAFHNSLGNNVKLDRVSLAFTLGYLAGSRSRSGLLNAPSTEALTSPKHQDTLFLDMDDTLYQNDWEVAKVISKNIRSYCTDKIGLEPSSGRELWLKYGTTVRGLLVEKYPFDLQDYMIKGHDISSVAHLLKPDIALNEMLGRANVPLWIFTASTIKHVDNVLSLMQARHLFEERVIACTSKEMGYGSKHEAKTFDLARAIAGVSGLGSNGGCDGRGKQGPLDPSHCYFADDSRGNIKQAKQCGWHTCLIGHTSRTGAPNSDFEYADHVVDSVHELEKVWPHLFNNSRS